MRFGTDLISAMKLGEGLLIAVIGIAIVFFVLLLLVYIVRGFTGLEDKLNRLSDKKNNPELPEPEAKLGIQRASEKSMLAATPETPLLTGEVDDEDGRIVAVITAAIAAVLASESRAFGVALASESRVAAAADYPNARFIVRDIRRL